MQVSSSSAVSPPISGALLAIATTSEPSEEMALEEECLSHCREREVLLNVGPLETVEREREVLVNVGHWKL